MYMSPLRARTSNGVEAATKAGTTTRMAEREKDNFMMAYGLFFLSEYLLKIDPTGM
jgi:hypothetical protein